MDWKFFRLVPYFRDLDEAALRDVQQRFRVISVGRGEPIQGEGEPCYGLYIVVSGLVKVFRMSPEGREQVVATMGPGETFNDVPVFDGGPTPANVVALEPTTVVLLSTAELRQLIMRYPQVANGMLGILAARLRSLVTLVSDLALLSVEGRIAKFLLTYAEGVAPQGGVVGLRLTQQDLAALVGTAREVVARELRRLEESGALRRDAGIITIVDRERLQEVVSGAFK
ncbi:MAG: Crp/Fnr family transcriptional regulator [Chloroflexi bacterium]|nr:Crp/Fnr family transcriptional regulator [Chloroflexota bacterium]